ncbi:MAG: YjbF family lipoprotein [Alkalilacustris sp.]
MTRNATTQGTRLRLAAAVAAATALTACSDGLSDSAANVETQFPGLDRLVARVTGRAPSTPPPVVLAPGMTQSLLSAELPTRGTQATLAQVGRNGPVTTWRTADGVSIALRGPGVVVATRGLGADIHIADAAETAAALAAGRTAEVTRRTDRLGGDRRLTRTTLDCTITLAARDRFPGPSGPRPVDRFEELCVPRDGSAGHTNRYWRDPVGGGLVASEQWIGAEEGFLRLAYPDG